MQVISIDRSETISSSLLTTFQNYLNINIYLSSPSSSWDAAFLPIAEGDSLSYWGTGGTRGPSALGLAVAVVTVCLASPGAVFHLRGGI